MLWILVFMFFAVVAAGLVALFVAYPHRGEEMPVAPRIGARMRSAADAIPLLDDDEMRARALQRH